MNDLISAFSLVIVVISAFLIWVDFVVQCVERGPYHVVIQFNNWLNYFPDCPDKN
ncbi:hypothetical protein C4A70_00952 [Escherichia coli]|nr:hypothetical protein C4A70_00952 [Escherichia coli]